MGIYNAAAMGFSESETRHNHGPDAPEFSEEFLARRFTALHGDNLRYVAAWGRWLEYDGKVWRRDDTLQAFDLARAICREAAAEADKDSTAKALASAATVAAVERLARADREHAAIADQWDADDWLLNTPGGVVDLTTGTMRPHRLDDYFTKMTAVTPSNSDCPIWRSFLDRITAGDVELQDYLQRLAGYSLTGSTREEMFAYGHGTGGNGKSKFVEAITAVMGDYATTAAASTFMAARHEAHPTDLAGLQGARLVVAVETEQGTRWAESKIKSLTGGDTIRARFMRQDFFEFRPRFKLLIVGNHRPEIRNIDEAMRRRLHLIPFTVTIPPEERDKHLADKLRAEWPQILAWMIQGCLEWQRQGLNPPPSVQAATAEYLASEDSFSEWLRECTKASPLAFETSSDLFASWRTWAEKAGEFAGSQKRFGQQMHERGYESKRQGTGRKGYSGIMLLPTQHAKGPYDDF